MLHAAGSHRAGGRVNLYGFAAGDPVNYADPFGLTPCPPCDEGEGGAGKALAAATAIALAEPTPVGEVVVAGMVAGLGVTAAIDATRRQLEKPYVTYTLTNGAGQTYVGRASGQGDPQSVMMQRYSSHHMRALSFGNPTLDRSVTGPQGCVAIRGREQQMIDAQRGRR